MKKPDPKIVSLLPKLRGLVMPNNIGDFYDHSACFVAQGWIIQQLTEGRTFDDIRDFGLDDKFVGLCKVVRKWAIGINDGDGLWSNDKERTRSLRPLIPYLFNTASNKRIVFKRSRLALQCYRELAKKIEDRHIYPLVIGSLNPENLTNHVVANCHLLAGDYRRHRNMIREAMIDTFMKMVQL